MINRQHKRAVKRQAEEFESRRTFAPFEIIEMNLKAYEVGVGHALDAAASMFGLGEKRLLRFHEKLGLVQTADGIGEDAPKKPSLEKAAAAFDSRKVFTKEEAVVLNAEAYKVAIDHITDAVSIVYKLGPKRLKEYQDWMKDYVQAEDRVEEFMQDGNPHALRIRRAARRDENFYEHNKSAKIVDLLVRP